MKYIGRYFWAIEYCLDDLKRMPSRENIDYFRKLDGQGQNRKMVIKIEFIPFLDCKIVPLLKGF